MENDLSIPPVPHSIQRKSVRICLSAFLEVGAAGHRAAGPGQSCTAQYSQGSPAGVGRGGQNSLPAVVTSAISQPHSASQVSQGRAGRLKTHSTLSDGFLGHLAAQCSSQPQQGTQPPHAMPRENSAAVTKTHLPNTHPLPEPSSATAHATAAIWVLGVQPQPRRVVTYLKQRSLEGQLDTEHPNQRAHTCSCLT